MAFLENEKWFADLMVSFTNPILAIVVGAVLTGVIQSSSASVGILQSLCSTGLVTGGVALPIILGQNIGTCVTALISTIGANRNARRAAMVHLYFNLLGVIIFAAVFYGVGAFVPWGFLTETMSEVNIAMIHTTFNVITTIIMLPLHGVLEKLATLSVPEDKEPESTALLDQRLIATPAVAIQRAQEIAADMAQTASQALDGAIGLLEKFDSKGLESVKALENKTDEYEDALGTYLVQLTGTKLSVHDNRQLNILLYTISDVERIADHAVSIGKAGEEIYKKDIAFSDAAKEELKVLSKAVQAAVKSTVTAYCGGDLENARRVEPQEQVVDSLVKEIKSRHVRRLRNGQCKVEYGFVLEDLLTSFERVADHCSNIAVEMLQVSEGKLEAHEYLTALKAGELTESAKFDERFEKYRKQYTFPDEE